MPVETISTANLDYLQRGALDATTLRAPRTAAAPGLRVLLRVRGVGRIEKGIAPAPEQAPHAERDPGDPNGRGPRLPTEDLLTGLYGYKIPLAFLVHGRPEGVAVHLGTWAETLQHLDPRQQIVDATLRSLYPAVDLAAADARLPRWPRAGLVLGIPTAKPPEPGDGALPLDRLIRALAGAHWACLILAQPVAEGATIALRHDVINELRAAETARQAMGTPSPLVEHYTDLLKRHLTALSDGQATGAWRAGVCLLGDDESYWRLASVWRAVFAGPRSLPEPIRVCDIPEAADLAAGWALPDAAGARGPGHYHHPFACQTLLTSAQLAAYVHLPRLETAGFTVRAVPEFDAEPPTRRGGRAIALGKVVHRTRETLADYAIDADALDRHVFVAGVTGSGKTNTTFYLLRQAAAAGAPFLVIEPAKTEYRALLGDATLGTSLRVYTLGNERVAPFRLNPFEVPRGTAVGIHLDLLRSVFNAAFGMWTPLPQVLEQCLHAVYADRGWDITSDRNRRLEGAGEASDAARADAFPTLSDLVAKVDEVTRTLGYEEKTTSHIRAALLNRLNGLRIGGKGRMLDTRRPLAMGELLRHPTVLELEGMGDDDDKAFLMGLLLARLVEHRRAAGPVAGLQHLLVVEEAHRLLANVPARGGEEEGNPRGKAVETFANLLAEIRAYGQGVVVADQVPVKLAPDVIKNTNLKIVHRLVARDDREALAGAMGMNPRQAEALSTLTTGRAAVFSEGDDTPVLVQVPDVKNSTPGAVGAAGSDGDARVSAHMAPLGVIALPVCETCGEAEDACDAARRIAEAAPFRRALARTVLSTIEDVQALDRLWPDVLQVVRAARPPAIDEAALLRGLVAHGARWYAQRRGAQGVWAYADTTAVETSLRRVLLDMVRAAEDDTCAAESGGRAELRARMRQLMARRYAPFHACERICRQDPPLCLYRHAAADLVDEGSLAEAWHRGYLADRAAGEGHPETWQVCLDAGYGLIEFPEEYWVDERRLIGAAAARRASLCFAQHALHSNPAAQPRTIRLALDALLEEATR